jgi:hypothetical protein
MACHEVAALRLGLMRVLGIVDEAERQHELAELGEAASRPGPLCSLTQASDLAGARRLFESALADLDEKVAKTPQNDPKLAYYRALVIFTKKVELELAAHSATLERFYRDLEEMHDFLHEIYPAD